MAQAGLERSTGATTAEDILLAAFFLTAKPKQQRAMIERIETWAEQATVIPMRGGKPNPSLISATSEALERIRRFRTVRA